ncbi:MAG: DUF1127 domain-containing protein [Pseudomonadota bacterium]
MHTTQNHTGHFSLPDLLQRAGESVSNSFMALAEANARTREIEELKAMSDADLRKLGITRDRIVHHVFRDLLHV